MTQRGQLWDSTRDRIHDAAYDAAWHTCRLPNYYARLARRSPEGLRKALREWHRWALDVEGKEVRRGHVGTMAGAQGHERSVLATQWRQLAHEHQKRVRLRMGLSALGAGAASLLLVHGHPGGLIPIAPELWVPAGPALLGWYGKRADDVIVDSPVHEEAGGRSITGDMVLQAFIDAKLCTADRPITFASPGVHRDGDGHGARIYLPKGTTTAKALEKQEEIASSLDVKKVQVFLGPWESDATERRVEIWVARRDPYAGKPPVTPLAQMESLDFWQPFPFGLDAKARQKLISLVGTHMLVGAMTNMGKTVAGRGLVAAAALDPYVQLYVLNGKGDNAYRSVKQCATWYGSGIRTDVVRGGVAMLGQLRAEMERRNTLIEALPLDRCPDSELTPALSRDRRLNMPRILLLIDEAQRYFEDPTPAWEPEPAAGGRPAKIPTLGEVFITRLIDLAKVGRSVGLSIVILTQNPTADTVPTGIRSQCGLRFCLKVMTVESVTAALGSGAVKKGYDASKLEVGYKGVGWLLGVDTKDPDMTDAGGQIIRTYFMDVLTLERICKQGRALREKAGTLGGVALGEECIVEHETRNLLEDIRAAFGAGEAKLFSRILVERLARAHPDAYDGWDENDLATKLRPHGVTPKVVKAPAADGEVKGGRGYELEAIMRALGGGQS